MSSPLSSVVAGAAAKVLSAVEANLSASNQHEFNGVAALKRLLGEGDRSFEATLLWIGEEPDDIIKSEASVTWYDARKAHPIRTEHRLYFPSTDVTNRVQEGCVLFVLLLHNQSLMLVFTPGDSTAESQLRWLLGLESTLKGFSLARQDKLETGIGFAARAVLDGLGLSPTDEGPADSDLDVLLAKFGDSFPRTAELSLFARELTDDADAVVDPDGALIAWLEREEALFRQLERHYVLQRLRQGFVDDVDGFVAYSLSVQNRRKARVGLALEHHTRAILDAHAVKYSVHARTENKARPDFLFPSEADYHDPFFPKERLTMLGVKSTCKERWRQILAEADRIESKHLLTLETGISVNQTTEMASRNVTLVLPAALHSTMLGSQRHHLMTMAAFVEVVSQRQ